ncbi:Lumazine synthase [Ascobolus immersus RN42]|uniref:6,7-dimethyl-8-ribityllumazine synthase n=1 Tax=Ascobolus immersus RN42 TaxID=1160509 RepID=A0A3N4IBA8_ASCIM|nr:Lumazine synthase [Ascobolus immersus RN42]
MTTLKGPGEAAALNGSQLRIAIVHARWNSTIIEPLVAGAKAVLLKRGVKEQNIVIESVAGSWELPIAVQRLYSASQVQAASRPSGDLLGASHDLRAVTPTPADAPKKQPFDAIIAVGVLIKGDTMHFEYIAETVSHGLMRVQLDFGVPVIFGVLTVLTEEQAQIRAGMIEGGHNHGEDWGEAAVEMGVKRNLWNEGIIN